MRIIPVLSILVATSSVAAAEAPGNTPPMHAPAAHMVASPTYVGVGATLTNGLSGKSEFGAEVAVAPVRYLELQVGTIRHDVHGHEGLDYHQTWLLTTAARAKVPFHYGALFVGVGLITGEHSNANGCSSTGFIDFCGGADTHVNRHWDRAVWIAPEVGGEVALGPVAMRMSIAPLIDVSGAPDYEDGCLECDDDAPDLLINIGIHGRIPMF